MKASTLFFIFHYLSFYLLHAEHHGHHHQSDPSVLERNPLVQNFQNIFSCDATHMVAAINNILCTSGNGESYHSAVFTRAKLAATQILTEMNNAGISDNNIQESLLLAVDVLKNIFEQSEQLFSEEFSILEEPSSKDKIDDILSMCSNFDEQSTVDRKLVEVMFRQEETQNMETQIEKPIDVDTSAIDVPASETNTDVQEVKVNAGISNITKDDTSDNLKEEINVQIINTDLTKTENVNVVKRDLSKKNPLHDFNIKSDKGCNKLMQSLCTHTQVKKSIDKNILMIAKAAEKIQEARNIMVKKLAQTNSSSASGVTGLLMSWAVLQAPMQEMMEAAKSLKEAKLAVETETDSPFHSLKSLSHMLTNPTLDLDSTSTFGSS